MLRRMLIAWMAALLGLHGAAFAQDSQATSESDSGAVSWQQDFGVVSAIKVSGNVRIEAAAVLAAVQLRVGEQAEASKLRRDLKSVFATGLFQDVRIDVSPAEEEGVEVTFLVLENPAIRAVNLTGFDKVNEDDIREVLDINSYAVLNSTAVSVNQQRIRELYVDKGYFLAEIEPVVHEVSTSLVDLEFAITENRKVYVETVDITGNESLDDRAVLKFMSTRPAGALPWLTGAGTYRSADLENDVYVVRSVFLEEGFVDVQVAEPKVYLSPDKRTIAVTLEMHPWDLSDAPWPQEAPAPSRELSPRTKWTARKAKAKWGRFARRCPPRPARHASHRET